MKVFSSDVMIMYGREKEAPVAIVLIEEVLMGLGEVRISLDQAVTVLRDIVEDMPPHMGENLRDVLAETYLQPLESRLAALDTLLEDMASNS
jgi:hypothetical protein